MRVLLDKNRNLSPPARKNNFLGQNFLILLEGFCFVTGDLIRDMCCYTCRDPLYVTKPYTLTCLEHFLLLSHSSLDYTKS